MPLGFTRLFPGSPWKPIAASASYVDDEQFRRPSARSRLPPVGAQVETKCPSPLQPAS